MIDLSHLEPGDLFEAAVIVGSERVELLAEVEIDGPLLHLRDLAVYPAGAGVVSVGLVALLGAARSQLLPAIRAAGFDRLRVTGTRLSGASPGRIVDLTIDLTRDHR